MSTLWKTSAIAVLAGAITVGAGAAQSLKPGDRAVFERTVEIVNQAFYRPAELAAFNRAAERIVEETDFADGRPAAIDRSIDALLASLETSHTARYTPDQVEYFELIDVFRFNYRRELRRLFPPEGEVSYEGIGIATETIDGALFVSDVYDGGPAARANIKVGDEILAADGEAFAAIGSFRGKAGSDVVLTVRRKADGPPLDIRVRVEELQPSEALLAAISNSIRVVRRDGRRIGYLRIWAYTRHEVDDILNAALGGRLADADGLILDLRGRWGGAPADAAELLVGGTPEMRMVERDGDIRYVNTRWRKPVVAIIDGGTRSGMDIFANALKQNGIPLVGSATAGDVVAGRGFLLPDDSLLVLAVADVLVDGRRLEGNPVEPDVDVPFDFRYANGADPQFDAALDAMTARLTEG